MSKLTHEDIDSFWMRVHLLASVARESITLDQCAEMRERCDRSEALIPIFDPTLYLKHSDELDEKQELLRATHDYLIAVNRVAEKELARKQTAGVR